ncbi:MAG: hypothetical protein JWQ32_2181 [Marmoricola sp.]|nr:hypothetical protein [Marmoricola sp.]
MNTMVVALHGLAAMADPVPTDNNVKAGWVAFAVFIWLIAAVGVLCWSLVKHLKKAKLNAESGVFGEDDDSQP